MTYNKIPGETYSVPGMVNDFIYMDELLGRDSLLEYPRLKESKDILLHARNPLDVNDSIDNLQKGGFEIIDRIDKLASVRVRIHDPVKFAKFIESHDDDFGLSKNVTLRRPTYPNTRMLEIEEPFMGSSMDWLGSEIWIGNMQGGR